MTEIASTTPADSSSIRVQSLAPELGVKITGVDLSRHVPSDVLNLIRDAWHAHGVLCMPGQRLDEIDQVRFGEYFGTLAHTQGDYAISKSHPSVMYVTNEKESGKYIGALPDGEMYFHSDMCYVECPSKATILYAMHIPSKGGHTLFANMYKAYEGLPQTTRERIGNLKAMNCYEPGADAPMVATRTQTAPGPNARSYAHPMVCTHPVTQKKALYVNRLMTEYVLDMPRDESNRLLESLYDHQEQPQFIYEHHWSPGDLVMWDNRCILHARTNFDAGELRKLRRVTVKGDKII